jgi:dienelactone hydrolase
MIRTGLFIFSVLFFAASCSYLPQPIAEPSGVEIMEFRDYLLIEPSDASSLSETGLLFYPGGLVDPHAYISLCSAFALSGNTHQVIIARMPANLAVLDVKAARGIIKEQERDDWVIAGHSLGGAMACSMVEKEEDLFRGLILMAAYPGGSTDLNQWEHPVLSITATEDRVLDWDNFEGSKERLPPGTLFESIEGGNHGGFGQYGEQKEDGIASISQAEQESRIVELMQNFYLQNGLD